MLYMNYKYRSLDLHSTVKVKAELFLQFLHHSGCVNHEHNMPLICQLNLQVSTLKIKTTAVAFIYLFTS